jgi:hypothetical protein
VEGHLRGFEASTTKCWDLDEAREGEEHRRKSLGDWHKGDDGRSEDQQQQLLGMAPMIQSRQRGSSLAIAFNTTNQHH